MTDHFSNMISAIQNGYRAKLDCVVINSSKLCLNVLEAFERAGFISGYKYVRPFQPGQLKVRIYLRYDEFGPLVKNMQRISSSGKRIYISVHDLKSFKNGLGCYILSTSKGVVLDSEAKQLCVGGELLCKIF